MATANADTEEGIFKDVRFYEIGSLHDKIKKFLVDGKAKQESYLTGLATHAIATDFSSIAVEEAVDVWQIPVVTEKWVDLSVKCKKLLPTGAFTPSNSQLFSGLVICPSNLKKEDRDLLWALVTFYGGSCQLNLNKSCTHLVVCEPKGAKYDEAIKRRDVICIVTLDWIQDSVKDGKLQDATKYHPSLAIVPQAEPIVETTIVPDTQDSTPEVISSNIQKLAVSAAEQPLRSTEKIATITQKELVATSLIPATPPTSFVAAQHRSGTPVSAQGSSVTQSLISLAPSSVTHSQAGMSVGMMPEKKEFYTMGQSIVSQAGQQYILTGQSLGQPQVMTMQQFQMQRPAVPSTAPRFSVHPLQQQRFSNPTQAVAAQRKPSPTQKKAASKRRRSSAKSKANAATPQTPSVSSSPMHGGQMPLMAQQQQFLQQQNQQQLMMHRMTMMQQQQQVGQTKVNFMQASQQQMYQAQHFPAGMPGKPQVPPTSPQNQPSGMIGDQVAVRPFMGANFQANVMRMQQPQLQTRPVQQVHAPQMFAQQIMAMGLDPQMQQQIQQQQAKMTVAGQQPQFAQQQGVMMPRGVQMPNQPRAMSTAGKMQPQRMQMPSQQQQGMFVQQQHTGKEAASPCQSGTGPQQHSPLKQQQQQVVPPQGQPMQALSQQQRQQQILMQQMVHQRQMQMQQQQIMQAPRALQPQQKQTVPPTSHAHLNVGMGVISPTALQQGLMMAQAQQTSSFQAPLIHPSLQTPQDYGKVTPQSGSSKSRRSKSRKPKDGDENADGKAKPKPRSRQKKSSQSPASTTTTSPGTKKFSQNSTTGMRGMGAYYQTPMDVMTPPPHPTVPIDFTVSKPVFEVSANPLAATENTFVPGQQASITPRMTAQSPKLSPKVETRLLPQPPRSPTPPPAQRGPFNDPLEAVPKSYEGKYFGHDTEENVPQNLCLLGCVFVIAEYQGTVPDIKIIGHWKKVINKFGGIVEEEYNICTCTHILCISQTTTLFKDALLDGKRCVTVYWLNDVLQVRKLKPPWLAIHVPTPFAPSQKPATSHTISYTGFHQKERERLRMMASVCGCKFSGFLSRSNTVLICKGTLSLKYDKAREWRTPCVNVHWLRDVLHGDTTAISDPGQAKYQNFDGGVSELFVLDETKTQKILDPWKMPIRVTLDCMQRARVKRKTSAGDACAPVMKRSRTEGSYQPLPRVCFTGLPTKQVTELQKTLESLQGQASRSISLSTHLVAERVSRTVKFLCAISVCQYIVTPEWIEQSGKSNWLLDEDKYLLSDKVAEEKFKFSLKESLRRSRARPLFKGYVFCITENVAPDRKILTEIIECAGGKVIETIPAIPLLKRLKARKPPNNHLLLVSCLADERQVVKWKQEGIPVHNAEIILSGVLKQEVDETAYQL